MMERVSNDTVALLMLKALGVNDLENIIKAVVIFEANSPIRIEVTRSVSGKFNAFKIQTACAAISGAVKNEQ